LIDYAQLLLLGGIAGLTIFLGLPMALLQGVSSRKKGFLNALAMGILVFLIVDVLANAWEPTKLVATSAYSGMASTTTAAVDLIALFGGLGLGLLGLALYEQRYIKRILSNGKPSTTTPKSGDQVLGTGQPPTGMSWSPHHLATLIAVGIGLHNFSEGLAIGQSYASGTIALAVVLIVGFGAHNATEGFGIAGPLTGISEKPRISFLARMGIIGGSPTFFGTVIGSLWVSQLTYVLFLSLAGGALIYVTLLMYNTARRQSSNDLIMVGIFVGLLAGFLTDLIVSLGGA
jgi:ZIP family zinc transporter